MLFTGRFRAATMTHRDALEATPIALAGRGRARGGADFAFAAGRFRSMLLLPMGERTSAAAARLTTTMVAPPRSSRGSVQVTRAGLPAGRRSLDARHAALLISGREAHRRPSPAGANAAAPQLCRFFFSVLP